jgi:hypothetical protein
MDLLSGGMQTHNHVAQLAVRVASLKKYYVEIYFKGVHESVACALLPFLYLHKTSRRVFYEGSKRRNVCFVKSNLNLEMHEKGRKRSDAIFKRR